MISVSLSYLTLIYLLIMLGPILGVWLVGEWRRQRRERATFLHLLQCKLCAGQFEDATDEPLPRCPYCGGLNERGGFSRL